MITRCQHKASHSLPLIPLKVTRSTNSHQGQVLVQRYLSLQKSPLSQSIYWRTFVQWEERVVEEDGDVIASKQLRNRNLERTQNWIITLFFVPRKIQDTKIRIMIEKQYWRILHMAIELLKYLRTNSASSLYTLAHVCTYIQSKSKKINKNITL